MIEAFAILLVTAISLAIYLFARVGAHDSALRDPAGNLAELRQQRDVLRDRLLRGNREKWDHVMMQQLGDRLAELERQIAEKQPRA